MTEYKLIDRDQMEASRLRRKLDPWDSAKSQRVRPVITEILLGYNRDDLRIEEPRRETNVYPLYYYYYEERANKERGWIYQHIFREYKRLFPEAIPTLSSSTLDELYELIGHVANTEVDLLIEDCKYFVFVEAKITGAGQKPKFEKGKGIHQLVRQYVQGRLLERAIGKEFIIATIGAGGSSPVVLNGKEKLLLSAIGEKREELKICDCPWTILDIS
ncbi:MAG: hypothetical protein ACREKR_01420 [Candidatus Methylomirabilales bacterium]